MSGVFDLLLSLFAILSSIASVCSLVSRVRLSVLRLDLAFAELSEDFLGALSRLTIASIASALSFWCPNWRRVFSIVSKLWSSTSAHPFNDERSLFHSWYYIRESKFQNLSRRARRTYRNLKLLNATFHSVDIDTVCIHHSFSLTSVSTHSGFSVNCRYCWGK